MSRDQRGVTTGYFGILAAASAVMLWAFVVILSYAASAHHAAGAADLSALAGAQARLDGRGACSAAAAIARANRAELGQCDVLGDAVSVEVSVPVPLRVPGLPTAATARATAEPATEPPP